VKRVSNLPPDSLGANPYGEKVLIKSSGTLVAQELLARRDFCIFVCPLRGLQKFGINIVVIN
jgi:hypothetical protein